LGQASCHDSPARCQLPTNCRPNCRQQGSGAGPRRDDQGRFQIQNGPSRGHVGRPGTSCSAFVKRGSGFQSLSRFQTSDTRWGCATRHRAKTRRFAKTPLKPLRSGSQAMLASPQALLRICGWLLASRGPTTSSDKSHREPYTGAENARSSRCWWARRLYVRSEYDVEAAYPQDRH
jgi:hypothetical protein